MSEGNVDILEVTLPAIWSQSYMNMSLILNGYKTNVDTPDELLARILDAAVRIKKPEDQPRRTTHDLRTPVAKCTEADGGIFEHLLWTVTNLSFKCNAFII